MSKNCPSKQNSFIFFSPYSMEETNAKVKILWSQDAAAIESTQVLVIYKNAPFLCSVPNSKKAQMIQGDTLVISEGLLFNANPIKQWCPIRSPFIR